MKWSGRKRIYVVIAENVLGHSLPTGALVHHVDENRENNSNDNLVILQSDAEHRQLHRRLRILKAGGDPWTQKICCTCGLVKDPTEFSGKKNDCRECHAIYEYARNGCTRETAIARSTRARNAANARWSKDVPRWDMKCDHCNETYELSFPNLKATEAARCPQCGGKVTRQPAAPSFTITGYNADNGYSRKR